ncbi:SusE domain-containing protein [Hymenobacter siberiensis]|jgi:hypothetical protein|uniref:SusE domain-containing protein n=1 Tax=Hymenobacter siberiensis TaxID=2848396 RepID=UPI001C1E4C77|nr:SusE domain-containing protein [Hymenobacter siberiensis]
MYRLFSKTAALAGLLALSLTACKKDEVRVNSEFSAPPVLTASTTNAGALAKANAQNTAVTYTWTPYTITTSDDSKVASTVTYTLQIAKAGTNFATVREISGGVGTASSLAIKTIDLNSALLFLGLPFGQPGLVDVRLKTFVAGNLPTLYSTTKQLTATPYDECTAPNADTWGLVGPAGDGWPGATATDRMLKWDCVANAYVLRSALNVGDFKFRKNQDWAINLGALTKPLMPGATATTLKINGEDMSIAVAGTYTVKLTITGSGANVTAGTLTVTP